MYESERMGMGFKMFHRCPGCGLTEEWLERFSVEYPQCPKCGCLMEFIDKEPMTLEQCITKLSEETSVMVGRMQDLLMEAQQLLEDISQTPKHLLGAADMKTATEVRMIEEHNGNRDTKSV